MFNIKECASLLHVGLLASSWLLICGLDAEPMEHLDNREALEVVDRRLEPEDSGLEGCALDAWFVSFFGSL